MFDKDFPLPKKRKYGLCDKLKSMEIGDSFEIEKSERPKLTPSAKYCGVKISYKSQRNGMVRVWRTS